ncbi:MAG: hypothetical protein KF842_14245 [Caulobacter sp.]|nr:hypothetical protein [Caulobacter sp.]
MSLRTLPLLAAGALVLATGAQAAPDAMSLLQGAWPTESGSVFTVSGTSGKLSKVSAADKAGGYTSNDLLVQGLKPVVTTDLKGGGRRVVYSGTCRSPVSGKAKGKVDWVVSDCELQIIFPADGGGSGVRLVSTNGSPLIRGQREAPARIANNRPEAAPAETAAAPEQPSDPNDTYARRTMSPEELAAEDAATARLNADVNARNAAAEARDRKRDADYKAAQAAREAEIRANQAAYDRQMADYRARVAASQAAAAKARADWEAAVAACKAGDRSKCAQN